jgi:tetratricopeptide (TPR) repeat protein
VKLEDHVTRRVPLTLSLLALLALAASASAQTARATGTVKDTDGKPIKGAIIRATNPDAVPPQIVSAADDKGRWAILGMRIGTYSFRIEAPGYLPVQADAAVRTAASAPLQFVMARDPGPVPGALPANIQAQLSAASMLRDQGRFDQAITAYEEIRTKNPRLTAVSLVMASAYRARAKQETDPAARRALLARAVQAYDDVLKLDADNERARTELASTRAEAAATPQ